MTSGVEWLNYHHLRYFWAVAHEKSLAQAAEKLHVSAPSISAQIRELEEALDVKLFRRSGRTNVLTDAGQMMLRYADEIFLLGRDMMSALKQRPTTQAYRLHVGVTDSLPKLVAYAILEPAMLLPSVQLVCREGKLDEMLAQLALHRLDIVLADEPTPGLSQVMAKEALMNFHEMADRDGCGVVIITHDIDMALFVADRIAVFYARAHHADFYYRPADGYPRRRVYADHQFQLFPGGNQQRVHLFHAVARSKPDEYAGKPWQHGGKRGVQLSAHLRHVRIPPPRRSRRGLGHADRPAV